MITQMEVGRGGKPGCPHWAVIRTMDGQYCCADPGCREGFMTRNDAQVFVFAAMENIVGEQVDLVGLLKLHGFDGDLKSALSGVLDRLERLRRELAEERTKNHALRCAIEHINAVGEKAHADGANPGCWACRIVRERDDALKKAKDAKAI